MNKIINKRKLKNQTEQKNITMQKQHTHLSKLSDLLHRSLSDNCKTSHEARRRVENIIITRL